MRLAGAGKPLPQKHVVLTFDDGYRNNLTAAAPILERHGFSATIFIATGYIGARSTWSRQHASIPTMPMMSADQLREMRAAGFDLGAHTHTHPYLTELDPAGAREEMLRSRKVLEDLLGEPVPLFSYPFGDFDASVHDAATEMFEGAISTRLGRLRADGDLHAIERINAAGGIMRVLPFALVAKSEFGVFLAVKRALDRIRRGGR